MITRAIRSRRLWAVGLAAIVPLVLVACEPRDLPNVPRTDEAIVLTGAQVPGLVGAPTGRIVAFAFRYGVWRQIPVQVDERALLDVATPKNATPRGKTVRFYTDANTWTGADPNVNLDADDEIAFMLSDAYGEARSINDPGAGVNYTLDEPDNVVAGSGVKIRITDPLVANSGAWVYLFRSDGTLDPAAGRPPRVDYDFVLNSGDYKTTYNIGGGANPESSVVTTPRYTARFSDRWINDQLQITTGGATGVDVLDRQKSGFAGSCARSEGTFSTGGGAMIANKSGPVRAIRSYLGANSGTYTQRDHIMYEGRMDVVTYLRVHPIPPLRDWIDYSPAASGMTYRNSANPGGVTIDGVPDTVSSAFPAWEMVSGPQGTIVHTARVATNIAGITNSFVGYYSDDLTPSEVQCTGDAVQYGASGTTVNQNVPDTDPTTNGTNLFATTRQMNFFAPNTPVAIAQQLGTHSATPLAVQATPFAP